MAGAIPSTKTIADAVLRLQHILLDDGAPSERHLLGASALLSRPDYSDVVIERTISSLCGFPLCRNPLPPSSHKRKARYRISLSEHRVYDLEEINKFCSEKCLVASKAYELSLGEKRSFDLSRDKIEGILKFFEEGNEELGLGFEKKVNSGIKEVKIVEKEGGINGEIPIDEWVNSAQAIEGYVPKFDWDKGSKNRIKQNNETVFTSEIIFGDISDEFSLCETKDISDEISKKLETIVLDEKKNKNKNKKKKKTKPIKPEKKETKSNLKSSLKKKNEVSSESHDKRSVKWADGNEIEKSEKSNSDVLSEEDNADKALRIESAEACVDALIRASEAISSGSSTVDKAVLEAGIVILPQPQVENEKEESNEINNEISKWPRKPVLLETDDFDVDDSWHDTPPDGFSLTLSPFGTMWMAIFEWVTSSSIAFIYGQGENRADEFLEVNGREYPSKIVSEDGKSTEIKKALDFFLCRALPSVVSDLRLPVPVSTLEKNLGFLIETMSFMEALPSFRAKQWRVIVLLFVDALSLYHLQSLSSILANRNTLLNKVLNGTQISGEEYDSMINLFLPFGRSLSLQSNM